MSSDPPRPGETPLSVVIQGSSEVTILPSEMRSFTCQANSSAVIRWSFNGGNLPANMEISGTGGYKSVLTISAAIASNAGVYTCLVHSQSGAFRDSASIQVIFYGKRNGHYLRQCVFKMSVIFRSWAGSHACALSSPTSGNQRR